MSLKEQLEDLRKRFDAWRIANPGLWPRRTDCIDAELTNGATAFDIGRQDVAQSCYEFALQSIAMLEERTAGAIAPGNS